ncbi:nuclear pore membrane glycoprotein 210-like [Sceloporus undulatus]|uniref:nuclear pore membrane glycoprotein 210-like n=1 Tax=Sceloporus undulatus TaxID=8520 RepID=UPI001C4DA5C9|nr:nuclear pore membrane glycoprotein 210-like [Sceloporus undulatus]
MRLKVWVAPVSYLQMSSTPKLYTANRMPLHAFPLGMSLTLTIQFYDSIGLCSSAQLHAITDVLSPESHLVCQVKFSETIPDIPAHKVFHVQSAFYTDKGVYACIVKVKAQTEDDMLALSTAEGSVYVTVTLLSKQGQDQTQTVLVPFLPTFYINQSEVVFSSKQLSNEIVVMGSREVIENIQAQPSSPVIRMEPPLYLQDMPGLAFPLYVMNLNSLHEMAAPVFVNLSCSLTGQRGLCRCGLGQKCIYLPTMPSWPECTQSLSSKFPQQTQCSQAISLLLEVLSIIPVQETGPRHGFGVRR